MKQREPFEEIFDDEDYEVDGSYHRKDDVNSYEKIDLQDLSPYDIDAAINKFFN